MYAWVVLELLITTLCFIFQATTRRSLANLPCPTTSAGGCKMWWSARALMGKMQTEFVWWAWNICFTCIGHRSYSWISSTPSSNQQRWTAWMSCSITELFWISGAEVLTPRFMPSYRLYWTIFHIRCTSGFRQILSVVLNDVIQSRSRDANAESLKHGETL